MIQTVIFVDLAGPSSSPSLGLNSKESSPPLSKTPSPGQSLATTVERPARTGQVLHLVLCIVFFIKLPICRGPTVNCSGSQQ